MSDAGRRDDRQGGRRYDAVGPGEDVPRSYKLWVLGSKLLGIAAFTVGIEMLTRGQAALAASLLLAGAVVVLAPVRGPRAWRRA
jgi:hypothetical protein